MKLFRLLGTAVLTGAGLEAGRRALDRAFDTVGWQTPKDSKQDAEIKDLREKLRKTQDELDDLRREVRAASGKAAGKAT